jgi:hypothetical protein
MVFYLMRAWAIESEAGNDCSNPSHETFLLAFNGVALICLTSTLEPRWPREKFD